MDVTPLIKKGAQVIQGYAAGTFRVSGQNYNGAVIVRPSYSESWIIKKGAGVRALVEEDFSILIGKAGEIDIVLLGCGAKMEFMEPGLKKALKDKGLAVDIMSTAAACRTYNVLMAEGRRVVAALIPV